MKNDPKYFPASVEMDLELKLVSVMLMMALCWWHFQSVGVRIMTFRLYDEEIGHQNWSPTSM